MESLGVEDVDISSAWEIIRT